MKKNPTLTIAIPAHRRPETLEKIIVQLKNEKNQDFRLLIADDSMDQSVEKMIKKYLKTMPNLNYHKNEENLGFNKNVFQLYELIETKYLWYLCDDDTVLEGCVDSILSAINKYKPSVAVFNCTWVNPYGVESKAGVEKDTVYSKIDELNDYSPLMRMTFLSILVFEKRIDAEHLKRTNYSDNIFIQLTLGLLILSDRFKYVEVAQEILHRNVGFKYGEFFKFYLVDHLKAVFLAKHGFNNQLFLKWSHEHLSTALQLYLAQKIGLFKYNGTPTKETLQLLFKY